MTSSVQPTARLVQHMILNSDYQSRHTTRSLASEETFPIAYSLVCHQSSDDVVAYRVYPAGRPMDCPSHNGSPHRAPPAGRDAWQAVS